MKRVGGRVRVGNARVEGADVDRAGVLLILDREEDADVARDVRRSAERCRR